jgi:hypothetical protein
MRVVRADLCARLDRLEASLVKGTVAARGEAAGIALIAGEYGMSVALRLSEGLIVALASGGRGVAVGPWIERLRDALTCDEADAAASDAAGDTWLASIMVRLAG